MASENRFDPYGDLPNDWPLPRGRGGGFVTFDDQDTIPEAYDELQEWVLNPDEIAEARELTEDAIELPDWLRETTEALLSGFHRVQTFDVDTVDGNLMLSGVYRFLQYSIDNLPGGNPIVQPGGTSKLLTVLGEEHRDTYDDNCGGDSNFTVEQYIEILSDVTTEPEYNLNRTVVYLEYGLESNFGDYHTVSRNLTGLMNLAGNVALKRHVDYRHMFFDNINMVFLYSFRELDKPDAPDKIRKVFEDTANRYFQGDMRAFRDNLKQTFVKSFGHIDPVTRSFTPSATTAALFDIPVFGPTDAVVDNINRFRDWIIYQLYQNLITHFDRTFGAKEHLPWLIYHLQEFWARVMDYYMFLVVARDMVNPAFVQFVVLVGDKHTTYFSKIFQGLFDVEIQGGRRGCVSLNGTEILTSR